MEEDFKGIKLNINGAVEYFGEFTPELMSAFIWALSQNMYKVNFLEGFDNQYLNQPSFYKSVFDNLKKLQAEHVKQVTSVAKNGVVNPLNSWIPK